MLRVQPERLREDYLNTMKDLFGGSILFSSSAVRNLPASNTPRTVISMGDFGERGAGHYGVFGQRQVLFFIANTIGLEICDLPTVENRYTGASHLGRLHEPRDCGVNFRGRNSAAVKAFDLGVAGVYGCCQACGDDYQE